MLILSGLGLLGFIASFRVGVFWDRRSDGFWLFGGVLHYETFAWSNSQPSWTIGTGGGWSASPYLFSIVFPPQGLIDTAYAALPLWLLLAPLWLLSFVIWRRDRRVAAGGCARCGYDMTGNVSGRCPECGVEVARTRNELARKSAADAP